MSISYSVKLVLAKLLWLEEGQAAKAFAAFHNANEALDFYVAVTEIFAAIDLPAGQACTIRKIENEAAPIRLFAERFPEWNRILRNNLHQLSAGGWSDKADSDGNNGGAKSETETKSEDQPNPGAGSENGNGEGNEGNEGKEGKEEPKPESDGDAEPNGDGGDGEGGEPKEEQPEQPQPQPEEKPKRKRRTKKEKDEQEKMEGGKDDEPDPTPPKPDDPTDPVLKQMVGMVRAGLRNLWMHGPAGCGKTTMAAQLANILQVPCYVLSCSKDTDPCQIQGRRYPQPEESKLTEYFEKPSVLVLDEFTSVEADTAMLLNSALANGYYETSTKRTALRSPHCVIIATSNTLGQGGDALYCGNSRLDASTRDRFACGFVAVDYSAEYESKFDKEVVKYANHLRDIIKRCDLQQICSTRTIINADALKKCGLDWKKAMTSTWTKDELIHLTV